MITSKHTCKKCESENIVLNGKNRSGSQTYKCHSCGCCRVLFSVKKTENINLEMLFKTYQERNSLRSTSRIFGVSHVTVLNLLKKKRNPQLTLKQLFYPPNKGKPFQKWMKFFHTFYSKSIRYEFGQHKTDKPVKSYLSLLEMGVWHPVSAYGENSPMRICNAIVLVIFGRLTTVFLLLLIRKWVKKLVKPLMQNALIILFVKGLVGSSGKHYLFQKKSICSIYILNYGLFIII